MLLFDDNPPMDYYSYLEMLADMDDIKQGHCILYRENDCIGCPYYDMEDQVCQFDK